MVRSSPPLISCTNNNLLVTTYSKLKVVEFPSIHSIFHTDYKDHVSSEKQKDAFC